MSGTLRFRTTMVSVNDYKFRMHSVTAPWGEDDPIVHQIRAGEFDEHRTLAAWLYLVESAPSSSIVLDVGAFAGLFSLLAVQARPDLMAVAFEPSSITYGRLTHNIQLNELLTRVLPAHLAAWSHNELIKLPHRYGIFTLCPGESTKAGDVDHTESVLAVALDGLLEPETVDYVNSCSMLFSVDRPIAAVKIDVEGVELNVLRGAIKLISKHQPCFICEALTEADERKLTDFFTEVGYRVVHVTGERNLLAIPLSKSQEILAGFERWCKHNGEMAQVSGRLETD